MEKGEDDVLLAWGTRVKRNTLSGSGASHFKGKPLLLEVEVGRRELDFLCGSC